MKLITTYVLSFGKSWNHFNFSSGNMKGIIHAGGGWGRGLAPLTYKNLSSGWCVGVLKNKVKYPPDMRHCVRVVRVVCWGVEKLSKAPP